MKKRILKCVLIIFGLAITNASSAQMSDTTANICAKHFENKFISDGQQYRALLMNTDETAEFHVTLYGGTRYRIAACSGLNDGDLIFSLYDNDTERNLLFTNKDFKVTNTLDCIIEAKLDSEGSKSSGRAVVLIGFKQLK